MIPQLILDHINYEGFSALIIKTAESAEDAEERGFRELFDLKSN